MDSKQGDARPVSSTTTPNPVTAERNVNPRFWMDERTVDTLSQKLTVPLQLQLDSVSDGLKEEYRNLLGSLRDDLYSMRGKNDRSLTFNNGISRNDRAMKLIAYERTWPNVQYD